MSDRAMGDRKKGESNTHFAMKSKASAVMGTGIFLSILGLTILSAIPNGTVEPWLKGLLVSMIAALGLTRIFEAIASVDERILPPRFLYPLFGIVAIALVQLSPIRVDGLSRTLDPYETKTFILVFGGIVVYGDLLLRYAYGNRRLVGMLIVIVGLAVGSSFFGIYRDVFEAIPISYPRAERDYAQFLNRNHFSLLAEMGVGSILGPLLWGRLSWKLLVPGWLSVAVLFYSIVAANSRGGLIAFGVMALFASFAKAMTAMSGDKRQTSVWTRHRSTNLQRVIIATAICLLSVGIITAIALSIDGESIVTRMESIDQEITAVDGTRVNRASIWAATVEMIKEHPVIGVGFGAYSAAVTRYDSANGRFTLEQAHNEYLEILANGGLTAAILFGWSGFMVIRRIFRNLHSQDSFRRACAFGSLTATFGVLIHSVVDFSLHVLVNALVFSMVLVMGAAGIHRKSPVVVSEGSRSPTEDAGRNMNRGFLSYSSLVAYFIIVATLLAVGISYTVSNYYLREARKSRSNREIEAALNFDPNNPSAYELQGDFSMEDGDWSHAQRSFRTAAELKPNDYATRVKLARAMSRSGAIESSEAAYDQAIALAPNYVVPHYELGRLLLDSGKLEEAFRSLSIATHQDQSYFAEVLTSANIVYDGDAEAIQRALAPTSAKEKKIVAWYMLDHSNISLESHRFVLSDELSVDEKNEMVRFLKERKNFKLAREIWMSTQSEQRAGTDASPIQDPGFESFTALNDASGFGWQVADKTAAVSVRVDRTEAHTGSGALRARFNGDLEPGVPIVSQWLFVEPGKRYAVSFFVRSNGLVSASLPEMFILETSQFGVIARSNSINPSVEGWEKRSMWFIAPQADAVLLTLQRSSCEFTPCPITGELLLDDVTVDRY